MSLSKKFIESTKKELARKENKRKLLKIQDEQLASEILAVMQKVLDSEPAAQPIQGEE